MSEKIVGEALTFDDVLLVPSYSEVLPKDADTKTRLTQTIDLNVPLVSAAMDTVTESQLAIAIAREGGIGIIHKNMSIEQQAGEVDRVKRSESGMIYNPITLSPESRVSEALNLMSRFSISGIPIVKDGKLVGILTNRDLRFHVRHEQEIQEVMTCEKLVTAPIGTSLEQAEEILHRHRIEKLPVIDSEGVLHGLITVKDIEKKRRFPNAAKDEHGRLRVGAAVGTGPDTIDRVSALQESQADVIVVDTAHGHTRGVLQTVDLLRKKLPGCQIVAGNVATREGAAALIEAGADCIKVGMGPGTICTTRVVAGIGMPQISAIMNCADVCREHGIPLIADGGIKQTGDIAKALAAGADTVMIGSLFAGTEESPGEKVFLEGRIFKVYRGMGSISAMQEGSSDRYFQADNRESSKLVPEGIEGRVPYRGHISEIVYQLVGGLRAAMGYCGTKDIHELKTKTKFTRISGSGVRESHPHDVVITRESPNYNVVK